MSETDGETAKTLRAAAFVHRHSGKPWFWPMAGISPALDYVIPILPNQLLMIALSALQPRRWLTVAGVFVLASSLGAFGAAILVQEATALVSGYLPVEPEPGGTWEAVSGQLERWGVPALAVMALSPIPPRTAVFVCATVGMAPELIALAVGVGRVTPATAISYLSAHMPTRLRRFPRVNALYVRLGIPDQN